ncbi:hypothetical protein [Streptomyces aureoverticillatus]|uniref:hypothetical protein n=1 Tax=Streptomyces aureoverticillatus TaxID=66871 RepID=UPI0013DA3424|nr:hypothetical protein [Streptomyces aureoverticillatus]QIB49487.1 hypothetical protein G3H79_40650 [Streptomyces aureoverticillatus]
MAATARRPQLHTFTIGGERFTAVAMPPSDLVLLDIEHLGLPEDRTGMQGLRGWHVYDGASSHIGRVIGRSTIVVGEWFDTLTEDWLLAKWGCRRLERAVHEIARLREDITAPRVIADARHTELQQRADYAGYLQRHGLVLDEDGDEMYAHSGCRTTPTPTFGTVFSG